MRLYELCERAILTLKPIWTSHKEQEQYAEAAVDRNQAGAKEMISKNSQIWHKTTATNSKCSMNPKGDLGGSEPRLTKLLKVNN